MVISPSRANWMQPPCTPHSCDLSFECVSRLFLISFETLRIELVRFHEFLFVRPKFRTIVARILSWKPLLEFSPETLSWNSLLELSWNSLEIFSCNQIAFDSFRILGIFPTRTPHHWTLSFRSLSEFATLSPCSGIFNFVVILKCVYRAIPLQPTDPLARRHLESQ